MSKFSIELRIAILKDRFSGKKCLALFYASLLSSLPSYFSFIIENLSHILLRI